MVWLRPFGVKVKQLLPMCCTELRPGPETRFEEAVRFYIAIAHRADRGESPRSALGVEERRKLGYLLTAPNKSAANSRSISKFKHILRLGYSPLLFLASQWVARIHGYKLACNQLRVD
jgi:hypothetical protein